MVDGSPTRTPADLIHWFFPPNLSNAAKAAVLGNSRVSEANDPEGENFRTAAGASNGRLVR
jgi:hypothetical protein